MGDISILATLCVVSGLLSAAICYCAPWLGQAGGLLDRPDGKLKLHAQETPLVGGLAMLGPSFAVTLVYFFEWTSAPFMLVAVTAAGVMLIVGVLDDRKGLPPAWRLVALTATMLAVFAIEPLFVLHAWWFPLSDLDLRIPLGVLAVPLTLLMVAGLVNAVNMADGMNGQLLGSVLIWSWFLSRYISVELILPFYALVCTSAVTLVFNLRGKLFSGSAGAYGASLFIGLGTIAAYRESEYGTLSAVEPILWFWLPILDCLRLMLSRWRSGKSPLFGDRNHIHHILQDDLGSLPALVTYLTLLAAPGTAAIVTSDRLAGCVALALCIWFYALLVYARSLRMTVSVRARQELGPVRARPLAERAMERT